MRLAHSLALVLLLIFSLSACNRRKKKDELRLGYLLNMSHAVPIVGLEANRFTKLEAIHFLAGGDLVNSLITGNIDIAYIGPGPFLNAINKEIDLLLLSGSSSGGNSYLISKEFLEKQRKNPRSNKSPERVGIPQYGNTQDLLARKYPKLFGEKEITYVAINPAELEMTFFTKTIDAAFVAEPWGTILESKGAKSIINDHTLSLNEYPAAMLVVYEPYFKKYPKKVLRFLEEQKSVLAYVRNNKSGTIKLVKKHLETIFRREIGLEFLDRSFDKIKFSETVNPNLLNDLMQVSLETKYIRKKTDISRFIYQK